MRPRPLLVLALAAASFAGCGNGSGRVDDVAARGPRHVDVELPQLEIHADGVDIFSTCPPAGGMTQGWIPKIPPWSPTASAQGAGARDTAPLRAPRIDPTSVDAFGQPEDAIRVGKSPGDPENAPSPAERAIRDTLQPFRKCHRRGLLHDPTQFGHVAIVARVGADGSVVQTESYGACELAREVVACMMHVAKRLRFDPPAGGSDTIVIPAAFAPRSGMPRKVSGLHDDYAAASAVILEDARPELHACDERERRAVRDRHAWGTFLIDVDERGRAVRQNIEPWAGNQELLRCASDVVGRLSFPPPPYGSATVRARLSFNPRAEP